MTIYVATNGKDEWSGKLAEPAPGGSDGPVRSLGRARDLAREAVGRGEATEVQLRGGVHRVTETLVLSPADSGTAESPATWRNYPGESPIISAAQPITQWRRAADLGDVPDAVPEEARPHLWVADLPEDPGSPGEPWRFLALFDHEGALPRAELPDIDHDPEREATDDTMPIRPGSLPQLESLELVELSLAGCHNFYWHILPVAEIDNEQGIVRTASPISQPLKRVHRGVSDQDARRIRLQNVPHGLTEPGRWWLDTVNNRVYLWPRGGGEPTGIEAPVLREAVKLEGDLQARDHVHDVTLEGLTFRHGERMVMRADRVSLQHDWEFADEPNAILRLRGVEQITVRNCTFHHSAGTGVRLDRHAQRCRVERNTFHDLGATGVLLHGYGPGTRDDNRQNVIAHNEFRRIARMFHASCGIMVSASSDNHVHDNLLHEMPYAAIVLTGPRTMFFDPEHPKRPYEGGRTIDDEAMKDVPLEFEHHLGFIHCRYNLVEHNEVHHVMQMLGDGNGIYVSGTGNGNVLRRNFVHDLYGDGVQSAIRTDGWQWYTRIYENIVWRVECGGLTVKQINDYDNNFLVDCRRVGCILARRSPGGLAYGSTVRRNILYQPKAEIRNPKTFPPFYEESGEAKDGVHGLLEHLVIDDNLLCCVEDNAAAEQTLQRLRDEIDKDHRSLAADPGFVDAENGDFRLREDSPAFKLGIRPIEQWGVRGRCGARSEG